MTLVLRDDLYDAQLVRALAYAHDGAAEIGECFETGRRITKTDGDLWYREWAATAERAEAAAESSASAGQSVSARDAYFRASNYFRTAGIFLMGAPVDDRLRHAYAKQTETFRKGAVLLDLPPEVIEIPYEQTTLPGYFFRADTDDTPRPTVILTDGYDGTVEELYFAVGAAALARGYTAPRAASAEHRLAACISDCGPYDLYDAIVSRIPGPLAHRLSDGNKLVLTVLGKALDYTMKKPSAGWALRRNLWVHGVTDPMELLRLAPQYTLKGREHLIRCPTFVCSTAGDDLSANAQTFADKLTCPHSYVVFGEDDDVSGHCEMTGRATFHRTAFSWLDDLMNPTGCRS